MIRNIVEINEELCNGCGLCVPGCDEGALQIIDNKARLVSDLMCDGLGACIGHCPQGAITITQREAKPYDEIQVLKSMINKGANTIIAHLKHLHNHNETAFVNQGIEYLKKNSKEYDFDVNDIIDEVFENKPQAAGQCQPGGCPGSKSVSFNLSSVKPVANNPVNQSQLQQWPVQLHLINPGASHFHQSDLLIASDCSAFALGDFHDKWLKNKSLVIACPKLDSGMESYINKISALIDNAKINTITVLIMEVPCCSGLVGMVNEALQLSSRRVPVKAVVVSIDGKIISDQWI